MYTFDEIKALTGKPSKTELSEKIRDLAATASDLAERLKDPDLSVEEYGVLKNKHDYVGAQVQELREQLRQNGFYTRTDALDTWNESSKDFSSAITEKVNELRISREQLKKSLLELAELRKTALDRRDAINALLSGGDYIRARYLLDPDLANLPNIDRTDYLVYGTAAGIPANQIPELCYLYLSKDLTRDELLALTESFRT